MHHRPFVLALGLASSGLLAGAKPASDDTRVRELLQRVDDLWRGTQSESVLSMQVKTEHYERNMRMRAWSKGKERSLIRILAPRKEKGSSTLKSGVDVYTYLPKTDRTIRLGTGLLGSSWMGSHLTNDDLVKESRLSEDYDPKLIFEGDRDGQAIIEIALTPKPDAPVVWGKVILVLDAKMELPKEQRYFDEDLVLARTVHFSEPQDYGDRRAPRVMVVTPADAPDEYTRLEYEEIDFEVSLDDDFFSLARLRRR